MKRTILILFIAILANACKQQPPKNYYWLSFGGDSFSRIDSIKLNTIEKIRSGDTTKWNYNFQWGVVTYSMLGNNERSFTTLHRKNDVTPGSDSVYYMQHISDTSVSINNKTYTVKKYGMRDKKNIVIQYYEPELGIFAFYDEHRKGIVCFQSDDIAGNQEIKSLVKATMPDSLFVGNLATFLKQ